VITACGNRSRRVGSICTGAFLLAHAGLLNGRRVATHWAVTPEAMLTELLADNQELIKYLRATHEVCDQHNDLATANLIENWIDETESRAWFFYETINHAQLYLRFQRALLNN
jgi:starvation-inducible DNA-binding protein